MYYSSVEERAQDEELLKVGFEYVTDETVSKSTENENESSNIARVDVFRVESTVPTKNGYLKVEYFFPFRLLFNLRISIDASLADLAYAIFLDFSTLNLKPQ